MMWAGWYFQNPSSCFFFSFQGVPPYPNSIYILLVNNQIDNPLTPDMRKPSLFILSIAARLSWYFFGYTNFKVFTFFIANQPVLMLLAGFTHILQSIMALQPTKKLLWIMRKWILSLRLINSNMTHFKLISDYITTITQSINQCNNLCQWHLEAHVFHIDEYIIV